MTDQEQLRPDATVSQAEQSAAQPAENRFTVDEQRALVALHELYEPSFDMLSVAERQRLRFVRWLVELGKVES